MTRPVTLLHTSPVHCATFDGLRDRVKPGAKLIHTVREDWLARAREGGVDKGLATEIAAFVDAAAGPVLCTCSTLGDAAAKAGAIRIDAPMMRRAAQIGGRVLLVYALESTRAPSERLLAEAMEVCDQVGDRAGAYELLSLTGLWPFFEAGDHTGFVTQIAQAVDDYLNDHADIRVVVLAQASMAGAAELLKDLSVVALSSPEPALQAALAAR